MKLPAEYWSRDDEQPLSTCRIANALFFSASTIFVALFAVSICQRTTIRLMQNLPAILLVAGVWSVVGAIRLTQLHRSLQAPGAIIGLSFLHFLANCIRRSDSFQSSHGA